MARDREGSNAVLKEAAGHAITEFGAFDCCAVAAKV
jgi:hypothetical protein